MPGDYVPRPPFDVVVTAAGQRKLEVLAACDPALAEAQFEAARRGIAAVLAGHGGLSRRQRRRGEWLLRRATLARSILPALEQ